MLRRKGKRQLNTMTSCQFHGCWTLSQAVLSAWPCNDLGSKSEWRRGCFVNLRPNVQFQRVYVSTSEKVKRNIIFMGLGFCFVLFIFWTSSKIYFVKLREKNPSTGQSMRWRLRDGDEDPVRTREEAGDRLVKSRSGLRVSCPWKPDSFSSGAVSVFSLSLRFSLILLLPLIQSNTVI